MKTLKGFGKAVLKGILLAAAFSAFVFYAGFWFAEGASYSGGLVNITIKLSESAPAASTGCQRQRVSL